MPAPVNVGSTCTLVEPYSRVSEPFVSSSFMAQEPAIFLVVIGAVVVRAAIRTAVMAVPETYLPD